MRISPVTKSLDDIFRSNFLKIPRFQRPYSWDKENVKDFWTDLSKRSDEDYFMGSTVLFPDTKEKNLLSIVDGQQRLTTITIALSIIRAQFDEMGEPELADGIQAVLERKDIDSKLRYVIEHEPRNKFFQGAIQQRRPDISITPNTAEERALKAAFETLQEALFDDLSSIVSKKDKMVRLRGMRDRILALLFISIQLDDEDDAYLIFETLNTRGKDLRVSDLLKNLFTRLIKQKNKSHDDAKDKWQSVMTRLESVSPFIEADTFLQHYWLAQYDYVGKSTMFKSMKEKIKSANARTVLDDLLASSHIYTQAVAPNSHKWANEELKLRRSLIALQNFRVAQATPLVFAVLKKHREKVIGLPIAARVIGYVEKFAFIFNAVTQSRGGGGIANMYARLAQRVTACTSAQQFADLSEEIKTKLIETVNDEEEFLLNFTTMSFRSDYTRERAVVRYVLGKFATHFGLSDAVDHSLLTIEHLVSESSYANTDQYWQVANIGNLLFVPDKTNGDLKTKAFPDKKRILVRDTVPLDPYLETAEDFTHADIDARGKELGQIGYRKIWWI